MISRGDMALVSTSAIIYVTLVFELTQTSAHHNNKLIKFPA